MGVQDLQTFLESSQVEGSCVGVDLVRIARSQAQKWIKQAQKKPLNGNGKFSLVVDAECCLDRLYGGYFSDWVCGGQWNRVTAFLGQFVNSLHLANIELTVFFNGCPRSADWIEQQLKTRYKVSMVLRHLAHKGTPPPKVWWTSPPCLSATLKMVLRNLSVPVLVSMDDHKQEVIAFCRENHAHGILADDADYIAFDPPRYFSAKHLKLTYKGTLETKEYIVSELTKGLGISTEELCVLAALLGNSFLSEAQLADLHKKLLPPASSGKVVKSEENSSSGGSGGGGELVRALAGFVKGLDTSDLEKTGREIFGAVGGDRAAKFSQSVGYYLNGTKRGFLRYRATGTKKNKNKSLVLRSGAGGAAAGGAGATTGAGAAAGVGVTGSGASTDRSSEGLDTSRLASEQHGNELEGLISMSEAVACLNVGDSNTGSNSTGEESTVATAVNPSQMNGETGDPEASSNNSAESPPTTVAPQQPPTSSTETGGGSAGGQQQPQQQAAAPPLPPVAGEILRTVWERHSKGLMAPFIYRLITTGEVHLPVLMEDENQKEIPSIQLFFRPLRRMVYAILFNLHHSTFLARQQQSANKGGSGGEVKPPEIRVKEWIWTKTNPYLKPELIKAEPLGWGVPTIQRLWFGTTIDDKRRRLRAFLTCMRSDTQLMLNPSHVPQHLLVLAAVLRYIMSFPDKPVLRKQELDAIIATAMDPQLNNSEYNQELAMETVSCRNVQIGALVMAGIEYALIVNEACGAPIPWLMTPPWLYFDGKLLHAQLSRAGSVKNLLELCGHRIPQVMKVERMREAILDGIYVVWARPPLISTPSALALEPSRVHSVMPAGMSGGGGGAGGNSRSGGGSHHHHHGGSRGGSGGHTIRGRGISTGGRLEIAGVVVGHWGPNSRLPLQPQVTSVGGYGGLRGKTSGGRGGGAKGRVSAAAANQQTGGGNRRRSGGGGGGKKSGGGGQKTGRGRGMTVLSPLSGDVVEADVLIKENEKKIILTNTDKHKLILENGEMKKSAGRKSSNPTSTAAAAPASAESTEEIESGVKDLTLTGMERQVNGEEPLAAVTPVSEL